MRNSTVQPIIRTLLDHIAERRSWTMTPIELPVRDYVDPAHLAVERRELFDRLPQVAALSPDLPEPGSHVTRDSFGVPIVLTRDEHGVVHAFANVCVHRGSTVVTDGRGCRRRLTCPYHAWTYDLDGSLVGVPDRSSFPDVDVPGPGLRSLPVLEEHGVIWVIPDVDSGATVDPGLGAIADDLDAFDVGAHRHWRSHRFDLPLNWKLVIDTFLEPYHFASLHRDTVGPLFVSNLCHVERFGRHLREVLPRRTIVELESQSPDTWDVVPHSAIVYVLFPNTVLVMQIDHIETWRVTPDPVDPSRLAVRPRLLHPRPAGDGVVGASLGTELAADDRHGHGRGLRCDGRRTTQHGLGCHRHDPDRCQRAGGRLVPHCAGRGTPSVAALTRSRTAAREVNEGLPTVCP